MRSLRRRAVVTAHVDEQRVVPLPKLGDGVDDPPDLGVGMGQEARVDLHQAPGYRLVPIVVVRPRGYLLGSWRQLGTGGNDAHLDLAGIYPLAQRIPALVELAGEPVRPLRPHVVGTVCRAGREVEEERLVGRRRLLQPDPVDCLVGEILAEVVVVAAKVRLNGCGLVVQRRFVLGGVAAQETVEAFEPESGGPAVERPGGADLPGRGEVRLAEQCGAVAVHAQDLRDRGCALRYHAVVARKSVGDLADGAHVRTVVVASGQQCGARRRAQRGGVELVVAQTRTGDTVQRGRRDRPTERGWGTESDVVEQDHDDVRSAGRWVGDRWLDRGGIGHRWVDDPGEPFIARGRSTTMPP